MTHDEAVKAAEEFNRRVEDDRARWWRRAKALCRLQDNGIHYPYDHAED